MNKTPVLKPSQVTRDWFVVDASNLSIGRIATHVARLLDGKHKATYTPHVDSGDFVIIINIADVKITGKKDQQKTYWSHSGYKGSIKGVVLSDMLQKSPETVLFKAVRGMLPNNKLRDLKLGRLKLFDGPEHDHSAQKPKIYEVK